MKQTSRSRSFLFMLLLFALFTAVLLLILLSGANAYQNISNTMDQQYSERTCLAYLSAKVRSYDMEYCVSVGELGGEPALILAEEFEGTVYLTYLYYYDGSVWELYAEEGLGFAPEDGFPILPVEDLTMELVTPELLRLKCTAQGRQAELLLSLQSGKGLTA